MPTELMVIGAGGHSKVVMEAINSNQQAHRILLVDEDRSKEGSKLLGNIPIIFLENWIGLPELYHIAIGNNRVRQQLGIKGQEYDKKFYTVIHPTACVSPSAHLGKGSFLAAMSVIAAEVEINEGCIVNHGAVIDHNCIIGSYSHISPSSTLGADVEVGERCLIGAGATLLPTIKVGHNVVVGAGAVVTHDVLDNQTVVGVPARCVSSDE